jgi:4-hydroxyphenylacetate 3-monooxygenase
MGARTGQEYVERLAQTRPSVELNGESVQGPIPEHPALAGIVRTYAELFDLQHDPALRDVLT